MKASTKQDIKIAVLLLSLFVGFNLWYYGTGDGSDWIQPIDALLFLGIAVIVAFTYLVEWWWTWPLRTKGGDLTPKQIEEMERKKERDKFIDEENKIW